MSFNDVVAVVLRPVVAVFVLVLVSCGQPTTGGSKPKSPGEIEAALGSTITFVVAAPKGAELAVEPLPLPAGMTFDLEDQRLTFTPQLSQLDQVFELTFLAKKPTVIGTSQTRVVVTGAPVGSPTSIRGTVRSSNTLQALSGVMLAVPVVGGGDLVAVTDAAGRFVIDGLPDDATVLEIDGVTADQGVHAFVAEGLELLLGHMLYPGQVNVVERDVFLPELGAPAGTIVDGGGILMSPDLAGVMVQVPFGSAKTEAGGVFSGDMFVPEVDPDFTPAALPPNLDPGLLVAIQPAGLTFDPPAAITFPNLDGLEPFSEVEIWSIDAQSGVFEVAGIGRVTGDGSEIQTIEGGIQSSSWHFPLPGPADVQPSDAIDKDGLQDPNEAGQCPANSAVEASAGALMVDHTTPSYWSAGAERSVRLNYHSDRAAPRPIINTTIATPSNVAVPDAYASTLEIAGLSQPFEVFTEASSQPTQVGVFFDATTFTTGVYPFCYQVTSQHSSSAVGADAVGSLLVHSEAQSPFGCGWMIDGLQRLYPVSGTNEVVITSGDSSAAVFTPQMPLGGDLRVEIAFVIDGSGSLNSTEFALQIDGIAAALVDPTIIPPDGTVAISVVQFSSFTELEVPLTVIDSPAAASSVASQVGSIVQNNGGTDIDEGLSAGAAQILPGAETARQVLCLITDGQSSFAAALAAAEEAIASGVEEIDSIGVGNGVDLALLDAVSINGSVKVATSFQSVAGAIAEKLRLVIGGAPSGEFSFVLENDDGTFTRVYRDGTRAEFTADGWHTALVDRNGNATVYAYDGEGRPTEITDPVGRATVLRYSGDRLSEIEDPMGRVTRLSHDGAGRLVEIRDPDGERRSFTYDAIGCMTGEIDRRGFTAGYVYDEFGRVDSVVLQDGTTRSYTAGDLAALVADGDATSATNPASKVPVSETLSTYTDELGNTAEFLTDGFGRFIREVDAIGRITDIERNEDGLPVRVIRPNGAVTEIAYDLRGNPLTVIEKGTTSSTSDDRRWTFTYEPEFSQLRSVIDPKGNVNSETGVTTLIEYDDAGNPTRITDALGTVTEMNYDEVGFGTAGLSGLLTSIVEALGLPEERTTTYRYDANGQLIELVDPVGRVSRYQHDAAGRTIATTLVGDVALDGDEQSTTYGYDDANRVVDVAAGDGGVTSFTYDESGNLVSVRDANTPVGVTSLTYDGRNRLVECIDQLGAVETYTYDLAGNLERLVDRKGQVFTWTYDSVNRPLLKECPGEAGALGNDFVAYGYDGDGNGNPADDNDALAYVEDGDSVLRFTWNAFDELKAESTSGSPFQPSAVVEHDYDDNGNRVRTRAVGSGYFSETSYAYDALDRLTVLEQSADALAASFEYDALSQRKSMVRMFGGGVAQSTYEHTRAGDLTLVEHRHDPLGLDTLLGSFRYDLDKAGNRKRRTSSIPELGLTDSAVDYGYDMNGRLVSALRGTTVEESYTYDSGGRRTSSHVAAAYIYDSANQLVDDGEYVYSYDANGNRTSRQAIADPSDVTTYRYDAENRLVEVSRPVEGTTTNRYDGLGRRIVQRFVRPDRSVARRTYVYDGEDILFIENADEVALSNRAVITHGHGIDEPLWLSQGGDVRALLSDGLTSVIGEVSGSGEMAYACEYSAFGEILAASGTASSPFGYAGRELDHHEGLMFYRSRHFDTGAGLFLQRDPAPDVMESGTYSYVGQRPTRFIDPFGRSGIVSDFFFGAWSYYRGVARGVRQLARRSGLLGSCEKAKSKLELAAAKAALDFLIDNPDLAADLAKHFAKEKGAAIAGRFAAGALTSLGLSALLGPFGSALGLGLAPTALFGDIATAAENGVTNVDALVEAGLTGVIESADVKASVDVTLRECLN